MFCVRITNDNGLYKNKAFDTLDKAKKYVADEADVNCDVRVNYITFDGAFIPIIV